MFDDCTNIKELQKRKFELLHSRADEVSEDEVAKINNEYMKARHRITAGKVVIKDVPVSYVSIPVEAEKKEVYGPILVYGQVKSNEIRILPDGRICV